MNRVKEFNTRTERSSKKGYVLGEDYYINEEGNWVFTAKYHQSRGYCCNNGCKHCPYRKPIE